MHKNINSRSKKTGLPPGSPIYIGKQVAQDTKINIIGYDVNNINIIESASVEECLAAKDKFNVLWIDIAGLGNMDMIARIGESFGLHPLVIEDVFNTQQRPKIDFFDNYIFLTARSYTNDPQENRHFISQQISLILGKNLVITIREDSSNIFSAIKERLQVAQNIIRKKGADYLLHALIDMVVDRYFEVVETIGDNIGELEDRLTNNPDAKIVKEIHTAKREIIFLRKSIWPLREVISGLQHHIDSDSLITRDTALYLKDIYDHTIQIMDTVETYRDFLASMLDVYLSSVSNKLNEVMKVLTIFASIFIPLTFISSLYGMNFNTSTSPFNMPELNWRYGYLFVWGIMVVVSIVMLIFFKRKKWW